MFGHDKDEDKNDENTVQPISAQPVNHGLLGIDDDDTSPQPSDAPAEEPAAAPVPPASFDESPVVPPATVDPAVAPLADSNPTPTIGSTPEPSAPVVSGDDDLLTIKREALEELSPLIDHLEQDAEEKFRTTMMMIQASDNKTLVPQAFSAAKAITDDAKRAQALLDIVNEINYFTQKHND